MQLDGENYLLKYLVCSYQGKINKMALCVYLHSTNNDKYLIYQHHLLIVTWSSVMYLTYNREKIILFAIQEK